MNDQSQAGQVQQLDEAWNGIESAIHALGAFVRSQPANGGALQRFEGYRTALIAVSESYVNQLHYDRDRPECLPFVGSIFNYTGPAPDFTYKLVHLQPGASYRVHGRRGDAELIDLQLLAGWYGQHSPDTARSTPTRANLLFDDLGIEIDQDGTFDFVMGPTEHDGQWFETTDDLTTLLIREYFFDYATRNRSSNFYFDKLDDNSQTGPTTLGLQESVNRLHAFANALKDFEFCFAIPQLHTADGDNVSRELNYASDAGASDQHYLQAHFDIGPDQALIGRWTVPEEYLYWSIVLYNDSYQMLNYANRQINLNHELARVNDDRTIHFVLSHHDPGIANWLDLDGHHQGLVLARTKGTPGPVQMPTYELVPFDQLHNHLPTDTPTVTPAERADTLATRRQHFHLRENR